MKILYGVQGTGNGHLTRARCLATEFAELDVEVDYVFSGRPLNRYFDMECFGDAQYYHGLTFATRNNRIDHLSTLLSTRPIRFFNELSQIHPERYDLVISDFEPLTAWKAKFSKTPALGIGHQYSFLSGAPWPRRDLIGRLVLRHFAPVDQCLGMHWHHFDGPILPPMIDVSLKRQKAESEFVLVYLPFAESSLALSVMHELPEIEFVFYSPQHTASERQKNVRVEPLSKEGFRHHLESCWWLVSSCGFGLVSEALHLGIPILTIPVRGQGEQIANVMALELLGRTHSSEVLNTNELRNFVRNTSDGLKSAKKAMNYPNVAEEVAKFCSLGGMGDVNNLVRALWR